MAPRRGVVRLAVTGALVALSLAVAAAVAPGQPSRTSVVAASLRAIGAKHPEPAFRNPDALAGRLIGPEERALLDFPPEALDLDYSQALHRLSPQDRGSVTSMFLRTVAIDSAMEEALRDGIRQIIVLGAGFDSRAHRFRDRLNGVRFIEVDQAPTQEYKRRRVNAALGERVGPVRYVAMDFAKDDLLTRLKTAGYAERERSFYIWEGVTVYLPESAVMSTLRFVREHAAPASRIVFDYALATDPRLRARSDDTTRFARLGEPWLFGFPGESAVAALKSLGLDAVVDVSYRELTARHATRPDGTMPLPEQTADQRLRRLAVAQVPQPVR